MQHFFVTALDGNDPEAGARRQAVRSAHFERIKPVVENRQLLAAGAILSEDGAMVGSSFIAAFENREALEEWIAEDPYTKNNVWQRIEIRPFRLAVLDGRIMP
jgi:uncharacterized protein